jgi:hypothetical protein
LPNTKEEIAMSLVERMRKLISKEEAISLSDPESRIYMQLQRNRDQLCREVIPSRLRREFVEIIYPDDKLKFYAQAFHRDSQFGSGWLGEYVLEHMKLSLSIERFGRKLLLKGIRPEDVLLRMLRDV